MKMSTVSFTSISNLVKNIYVSSHKRNVITVIRNRSNSRSHGNSGERANCHRFIFGHHTEQQQVHKIKFKCHLNVLHLKKKKIVFAQKEKIPAGSGNRVSEKAHLQQFICLQVFDIYIVKILRTIYFRPGKK